MGGAQLWHRDGRVSAFRFSSTGAELALASDKGIQILALAGLQTRDLVPLPGVQWLRWIDGGLLARARSTLYFVDAVGNKKRLTPLPADAIVAASPRRLVYFGSGTVTDVDRSTGHTLSVTKLADHARVVDAELSPDGRQLLFATAKRVYLIEDQSSPRKLADVDDLRSLVFAPDGSSYLWASRSGGALVANGKSTPLPANTFDAHYRQDGGTEIVITSTGPRVVFLWSPVTGKQTPVGDFLPLAADFAGDSTVSVYVTRSILDKEHSVPGQDLKAEDATRLQGGTVRIN
jgi:dipeptidyl aminopeptidase/acylaminoacyl peptidase